MPLDVITALAELVATPSVNPMGRGLKGPEFFEHRVTEYLEQLFRGAAIRWERQTVEPLRENIVARVDGDVPPEKGGPLVLFEVHQDTVPVDGMTIDPWHPEVRDGRLYGRGACDIKGGMAAMLGALVRLADERPRGRPTLVLACTVNEEHGYTGALALPKLWQQSTAGALLPRAPDVAVIAEPTNLDVVVAHKGAIRWRLRTHGRAVHSSQPQLGDNAVYRMARVLSALERYADETCPTIGQHPLCGRVTLSVGTIHGGLSVNTVPDECAIEIDRRLLPGETGEPARQQVIDYLREALGPEATKIEHEPQFLYGPPLSDTNNAALAERLSAAASQVRGSCRRIGVAFGTDAAAIAATGVPSVVFGPGSIAQAHTADEWVPLDELTAASEILYRFVSQGF
ncbi:MAG: M20 family metallopeptidase [Pirellulales bacterium]|nr:M20 family metallopeptidase [Pirellulales bacterium]